MSPVLLLISLTYALVLLGLATLQGELLALAIPLMVYLAAGWWFAPRRPIIRAERTLSDDRVPEDTPVRVGLVLTNLGSKLEEVIVTDRVPLGLDSAGGAPRYLGSLDPDESVEIRYTVTSGRGFFPFTEVAISAAEHFGVMAHTDTVEAPGRVFFLPGSLTLRQLPLRPRRTLAHAGPIPANLGGPGMDFFGVREYQSGDPMRWIHWKGIARHPGTLFSKEFEQERTTDVGLILDARLRSNLTTEHDSLFEYSVRAAATLAQSLIFSGNRVGMLVYGGILNWTFPGYGKVQWERILKALARAQPGESMVFDHLEHLPTRFFPAKSQLILIGPVHQDDVPQLIRLRAQGYEVLVVSPDAVDFEFKALGGSAGVELAARIRRLERGLVLAELRRAGVQIIDWRVHTPFEYAAHASLSRRPIPNRALRAAS